MNLQATEALQTANRRRTAIKTIRTGIGTHNFQDGCRLVADILNDPTDDQAAMRIGWLLTSITRFGSGSLGAALRTAGVVSVDRRVRDLSSRQREALAFALLQRASNYYLERQRRDAA